MQTDISYIAGFFDGEGTIYISRTRRPRDRTEYALQTRIVNTNKDVLDEVVRIIGVGFVVALRHSKTHLGKKPIWAYCATNKSAAVFLAMIRPFLRVKIEQALLGLEFQQGMVHHRSNPITINEMERRESCRQKISLLNSKHTGRSA